MSVEALANSINGANKLAGDGRDNLTAARESNDTVAAIKLMQAGVDALLANPVFRAVTDTVPQVVEAGEKIAEARGAYHAAFSDDTQPDGLSPDNHAQKVIEHIDVADEVLTGPENSLNANLQTLAATLGELAGQLSGAKATLETALPLANTVDAGVFNAENAAYLAVGHANKYVGNL